MYYEIIGHKVINKGNKTLYLLHLLNSNPTDGTEGLKTATAFITEEYAEKQGYGDHNIGGASCTLKHRRRSDGSYYDKVLLDKRVKE